MARTGRPKAELVVSDDERVQLERWAAQAKSALALRCRILLACADGLDNQQVAEQLGCHPVTVGKWRARFVVARLAGLQDEARPGRPVSLGADQVEDVVVATLETTPANATHWTRARMAERTGLSPSTIGRIWKAFNLRPHHSEGFTLSDDPSFVGKVHDVVGLCLNPPENAAAYCVDERSQVQDSARTQPAVPTMPGVPGRRAHDDVRHDTTTLFAAMDVTDGTVIGKTHRSHRASEFRQFLALIDTRVPAELDVHVVCDNYATHKHPTIQRWLARHPRFTLHFIPTHSSWINRVERVFAHVTDDLLRRGDHRCVEALEADLRAWVTAWNADPKPFVWTRAADEILGSLARLIP